MSDQTETPWITVKEAARYAKCGTKSIYLAVASGRLRAARRTSRIAIRARLARRVVARDEHAGPGESRGAVRPASCAPAVVIW